MDSMTPHFFLGLLLAFLGLWGMVTIIMNNNKKK